VRNHAIQIHGEADADYPLIHNVRIFDTGEQMIKVSFAAGNDVGSDGGIVEGCFLEYPGESGRNTTSAGSMLIMPVIGSCGIICSEAFAAPMVRWQSMPFISGRNPAIPWWKRISL